MEQLKFSSTALRKEVVEVLTDLGFDMMSPIQQLALPKMMKNKSILGLAPTGTGKTLAYALPIVNDLKDDGHVQAIIVSPTVALIQQVKDIVSLLCEKLGYAQDAVKAIYSNADFTRSNPLVLLITPEQYKLCLSHYPMNELKRIIIDEGDMVVFDGFNDILNTMKKVKEQSLISFFSASLNPQDIKKVKSMFAIQEVVDVRDAITNKTVNHHVVNIRAYSKAEALDLFLKNIDSFKTIAFVSKKEDLVKLAEDLKAIGRKFVMVHGGLDKRDIKKAIDTFRNESEGLMIASDYVSRGLDIPDVDAVISIDLPKDSQYYFHRAGRSGRFNSDGNSYVFYTQDDEDSVKKVQDLIRRGVKFDGLTLSKDSLRKNQEKYEFRNLGKKDKAESEVLQKRIRHVVNETKSNKVKPNYKKKVRKAVDLVKEKHRKKIVLTNIIKSGGNASDFHYDSPKDKKTRK